MDRVRKRGKTLAELNLLADPKVKAAYDVIAPEFEIARAIIKARANQATKGRNKMIYRGER